LNVFSGPQQPGQLSAGTDSYYMGDQQARQPAGGPAAAPSRPSPAAAGNQSVYMGAQQPGGGGSAASVYLGK
jgi:hypothetical protein